MRLNVTRGIDSPYMVSYLLVIVTIGLESIIKDLQHLLIYFNAFLMGNDKISCDLYRGQTNLSFGQHVDLW